MVVWVEDLGGGEEWGDRELGVVGEKLGECEKELLEEDGGWR